MSTIPGQISTSARPKNYFATTHWTVVLKARGNDTTRGQVALEKLCQTYWYPLYAYVRRRGYSPEDAQDLTQEFFARLLRKNYLSDVSRSKGKFRTFLLVAMTHFLSSDWDRVRAKKRGGGKALISLDAEAAEGRYKLEPADPMTAERIYERRWALTLLSEVLEKLAGDYESAGKKRFFEELRFCLTGERSALPYEAIAAKLSMTESAVKVAVHRLRQHYRQVLRAEIANTVEDPEEIEDELRHLFKAVAGG